MNILQIIMSLVKSNSPKSAAFIMRIKYAITAHYLNNKKQNCTGYAQDVLLIQLGVINFVLGINRNYLSFTHGQLARPGRLTIGTNFSSPLID